MTADIGRRPSFIRNFLTSVDINSFEDYQNEPAAGPPKKQKDRYIHHCIAGYDKIVIVRLYLSRMREVYLNTSRDIAAWPTTRPSCLIKKNKRLGDITSGEIG